MQALSDGNWMVGWGQEPYLTEFNVSEDLAAGTLERVLEDWTPPFDRLCLYYPGRRHVPAALRALMDLIRETG